MIRLFGVVTIIVASSSFSAFAQEIKVACKVVDGYEFSDDSRYLPKLTGRCNEAGLIQGDAYASLGGAVFLQSSFVDGLPRGPSTLWNNSRAFCKLIFRNPVTIESEINCKGTSSRDIRYYSPSGFNISRENGVTMAHAVDVQVELQEGAFAFKHSGGYQNYYGATTGLLAGNKLPLTAFIPQSGIFLTGAKTTISYARGNARNSKIPATIKSLEGPVELYSDGFLLRDSFYDNKDFLNRIVDAGGMTKTEAAGEFPAELEYRINYTDGTWMRGIPRDGADHIYYQDSLGREFNGLIEECSGKRGGARVRFVSYKSARDLQIRPDGCGSYKTSTSPEVRGIFGEEGVKPF